ncbi:MAG TPA: (d)CMP kinase [Candidatus Eisenbacteria bacterium]|nr:(d)CMP kinase [Candidatus Eisenbacteria bacterium]
MRFVVTIDGPAGAGKSTTARGVAARLGFLYVDTGALYRGIALKVLRGGVSADDLAAVERCARETQVALSGSPDHPHVWLDGADVADLIRTPEVSEMASRLAAQPAVRRRLIEIQRTLVDRGPLVAEGRDLGTVVYPDAEVKIYLDADLDTRAVRRARDLETLGMAAPVEQVRGELARRDDRDRSRANSPMVVPDGARVVNTSSMSVEEQIDEVLRAVQSHPAFPRERAVGQAETPGPGGRPGPGPD